MRLLVVALYVIIGGVITYKYKYMAYACRGRYSTNYYIHHGLEERDNIISIASGALWPIVAPFTFAILIANHRVRVKESSDD